MSRTRTLATARRVLEQLRRDPRTVALLLVVPTLLVVLMRYVFDAQPQTFDAVGPPLIGLFPFITMFLVTSITMLRERTTGTLERLMSMPVAKLDLLAGYGLAFGALATLQALIVAGVSYLFLGLDTAGPPGRSCCSRSAEHHKGGHELHRLLVCGLFVLATRWRRCSRRSRTCSPSRTPTTPSTGSRATARSAPRAGPTWRSWWR